MLIVGIVAAVFILLGLGVCLWMLCFRANRHGQGAGSVGEAKGTQGRKIKGKKLTGSPGGSNDNGGSLSATSSNNSHGDGGSMNNPLTNSAIGGGGAGGGGGGGTFGITGRLETKYKVVHNYEASLPDEISLKYGDVVEVLATYDDGWGRGRNLNTGKTGVFPMQCFISTQ